MTQQHTFDVMHLYNDAKLDFKGGRLEAALVLLNRAYLVLGDNILQFPSWENLLELLIICQCASQEFGQAEAVIIAACAAGKVIEIKRNKKFRVFDPQCTLAEIYRRQNNIEMALSQCKEIIAMRNGQFNGHQEKDTEGQRTKAFSGIGLSHKR